MLALKKPYSWNFQKDLNTQMPKIKCVLKKSLYVLEQSPRWWHRKFNDFMMRINFQRSAYDSCVYVKNEQDHAKTYLLLYVDDMFIASMNKAAIEYLKNKLNSEFEMKDLGKDKNILFMEIHRTRRNRVCFSFDKHTLRRS